MLLSCSIPDSAVAQVSERVRTQFYKYVQVIDTVSGTWRPLHALSRIAYSHDSLSITIWYHWADEYTNPLTRIALSSKARKDTTTGTLHYTGALFQAIGVDEECYIESCNEIADNPNQDFTISLSGNSVRYRMSQKELEIPRIWIRYGPCYS